MIDKNLSEFKLQSRYKSFFVYKYMQRTEIIIFDKVTRAKDIEKLIWFVNMYRRLYYQQNVTFDIETPTNNVYVPVPLLFIMKSRNGIKENKVP